VKRLLPQSQPKEEKKRGGKLEKLKNSGEEKRCRKRRGKDGPWERKGRTNNETGNRQ